MPAFTIKRFAGSTPRLAPHLLPGDAAAEARDCKLWHGTLESWRVPLLVRQAPVDTITSYLYECCWLDFGACVDIAVGPVNCRKLFTTGHMDWPAVLEFAPTESEPCAMTVRRLGVPCGDTAPSVVAGALGTSAPKDSEGRSYAYLYVNAAIERGSLSKASEPVIVRDGQAVVVSGWDIPDASWGVTHVQLYRSVSGFQAPGKETGNILDTTWMYVATVPIGAASYNDTLYNEQLISALEEDIADPPPADLRGIVHIDGMNCLAGYVGKRLYFSENNSYHQWPYYLDLDDNIKGICESNGLIYVGTDGSPYCITGATDCKNAGCREAIRLEPALPMVGGGNRRMAAITQGVVYPTHDGLVGLSGKSPPVLITTSLYAPDDWHKLGPQTVTPVLHQGKLFVFARGGSFVLTLPNGAEGGWNLDAHSTLSDRNIREAFVDRQGSLFLLNDAAEILQWDRGGSLRPHYWRSAELVTGVPVNFGAFSLFSRGGAEDVSIANDRQQRFSRQVLSSRVFRLPAWMLGTRWQITLEGTGVVSLASMATSMRELGA